MQKRNLRDFLPINRRGRWLIVRWNPIQYKDIDVILLHEQSTYDVGYDCLGDEEILFTLMLRLHTQWNYVFFECCRSWLINFLIISTASGSHPQVNKKHKKMNIKKRIWYNHFTTSKYWWKRIVFNNWYYHYQSLNKYKVWTASKTLPNSEYLLNWKKLLLNFRNSELRKASIKYF